MSVSAWVAEMQDMGYNTILVFRNQGEEQSDDNDNIGRNNFFNLLFKQSISVIRC